MTEEQAMQSAITLCISAARGLGYAADDSKLLFADMIAAMAHNAGEAARFAVALRDHASEIGDFRWDRIRAAWCHYIGRPRDGFTEPWIEAVGEQHDKALPWRGCARCEHGWIHTTKVIRGVPYPVAKKCGCRAAAEIAPGGDAPALEAPTPRRHSHGGLQRADVRSLMAGKAEA